jgi:hypothetical protein
MKLVLAPRAAAPLLAVALSLGALPAAAVVTQPTGEMMPNPVPMSEINIATARGFTPDTVTLQGLFAAKGDVIDPVQNAHTTPGTFSPQCGFSGQLVLRGGGCHVGFGWYNVTPGSTTPPPANQIYMLVPPALPACPTPIVPAQACCDDTEFCPLASYDTTQMPQHRWNSPTFTADGIRLDSRYAGGLIGFAMIGDQSTQCSQTKFSQAELNTRSPATPPTNGAPWVTVLIYQSTQDPSAYYIAFEDLPVTTATWKGSGGNDGDFNDFVYYITGLNCAGGGKACDTGMPGVCAGGTTQCVNGGDTVCKPNFAPSAELCDGLDNNCDGVIDEGNPCPGSRQICDKGVCVNRCNDTEFPCPVGFVCDDGYCRDPGCIGVTCPDGQICAGGLCQGGCDGVLCPPGDVCRIGRCVDPCDGLDCGPSRVCENGACVPLCTCRECSATTACAADGRCVDQGCEKLTCAAGSVCSKGACQDPCAGTVCPVNQACSMGACRDLPGRGAGGIVGTIIDASATGGRFGGVGTGSSSGGGLDAGAAGETTGDGVARCGCDVAGLPAGLLSIMSVLMALGILALRRARR